MGEPVYHYRWQWDLQSSPEALWPLVADTNRFDRDVALPAVTQEGDGEGLANARRHLRMTRLGVPIEWYEDPFEWVRPYRLGVVRRFVRGPVKEMRTQAQLEPRPGGGTRLIYDTWATPRNLIGHAAIPFQVAWLSRRAFDRTFRAYDNLLARKPDLTAIDLPGPVNFPAGGRERLAIMAGELKTQGFDAELVGRLAHLLETADDLTLAQLRPYVLADAWRAPRRAVLELCLAATRAGLLNMRWWLLCPLCRGPKQRATSLGEINPNLHCEVCNIDFTANFERSVELVFFPNPAVRESEVREFCIAGPQVTPHVVVQQLLAAGETRAVNPLLDRGRYRLRVLGMPGAQALAAGPEGAPQLMLAAGAAGWSNDELPISLSPALTLENRMSAEQLFILERMAWTDQAVTAAEVIAMQSFRDLFANEALRPGERISVGSQVIVFTDLRGSTAYYREVGDAVAFGQVMNHFDVLRAAVVEEEGAIVKYMGDAIMAVFRTPTAALRAMIDAQRRIDALGVAGASFGLKAGIHFGPCVAVTLNDRLDYFGSTVNMASRLEKFSAGGDVIISAVVHDDPDVLAYFAAERERVRVEPFEATLRGFEGEQFQLWRVIVIAPQAT
ncbi:MAG: hypothetical protein HZB53_07675 [Chloroflexi bacterium]|nr:hypothetical protein [Chloroflexota bacterium]